MVVEIDYSQNIKDESGVVRLTLDYSLMIVKNELLGSRRDKSLEASIGRYILRREYDTA